MMGVYIKGMVMPTSCTNCERWGDCSEVAWFFSSEYDYTFEDLLESELVDRRHPNCPLVEVPEPHGRLIDVDAFFKDICDSLNQMTDIGIIVDGSWLWAKLNDAMENAPTIIEGSE